MEIYNLSNEKLKSLKKVEERISYLNDSCIGKAQIEYALRKCPELFSGKEPLVLKQYYGFYPLAERSYLKMAKEFGIRKNSLKHKIEISKFKCYYIANGRYSTILKEIDILRNIRIRKSVFEEIKNELNSIQYNLLTLIYLYEVDIFDVIVYYNYPNIYLLMKKLSSKYPKLFRIKDMNIK